MAADTQPTGNAPPCDACGWANYVFRKRCRNCNADLVQHPDPITDGEVRMDAWDGTRSVDEARRLLTAEGGER